MTRIVAFADAQAANHAVTGGKGANLGRMTHAGFEVPPGYVVSASTYIEFVNAAGLQARIMALLSDADYEDQAALDRVSEKIRALFVAAPMPADMASDIGRAYAALGNEIYVAVRSSGTAEDLAGASFAGLHDTYLDMRGADGVIDAVKRCWGSLWSTRAIRYRKEKGFEQDKVSMAVVVQTMVSSEVSGVMFTGNPLTAATDEIVINASWGLGESVVQGIVNPDQYLVHVGSLRIKERIASNKTVEIIRDPETGKGTIERAVDDARQRKLTLSDQKVQALALLGRRVMEYYDGLPQDIEWAIVGNAVYLLQSRPITGVDFAWDSEVDAWQPEPEDDEIVWARTLADDMWTGAITPLMFSWRGQCWSVDYRKSSVEIIGKEELGKLRFIKYYRGEAYVNTKADHFYIGSALPAARQAMALKLPPDQRAVAVNQPFSYADYLLMLARAALIRPKTGKPYGWMKALDDYYANRVAEAEGLPREQLPMLSDAELKRYVRKQIAFENQYNVDLCWPGLFIYVRDLMTILNLMITHWYDGENAYAYTELVAGTPKVTATVREHIQLYDLSRLIRASKTLSEVFVKHEGAAFFEVLKTLPEGAELHAGIVDFLKESGHRGHADRDIYYPRYLDDLGVLYRALEAHVKSEDDPRVREKQNNVRRKEVIADVEANLRAKPFGMLKVEAFKWVLTYVLRFQEHRDDERHFIDRNTYSIRNGFLEMNRRIRERGRLNSDRDFWFLAETELHQVLDGHYNVKLTQAKIEGRMKNFDAFLAREWAPPKFLYKNRPLHVDEAQSSTADGKTVLHGLPTSRGRVTGTARVIKQLSQIGRVNRGEILIANSTDPGWTPVFAVISGVVVETGGLLSHSSCLAREYGFPAAQVEGALHLIPDGATITVDGDSGDVWVHHDTPAVE